MAACASSAWPTCALVPRLILNSSRLILMRPCASPARFATGPFICTELNFWAKWRTLAQTRDTQQHLTIRIRALSFLSQNLVLLPSGLAFFAVKDFRCATRLKLLAVNSAESTRLLYAFCTRWRTLSGTRIHLSSPQFSSAWPHSAH